MLPRAAEIDSGSRARRATFESTNGMNAIRGEMIYSCIKLDLRVGNDQSEKKIGNIIGCFI